MRTSLVKSVVKARLLSWLAFVALLGVAGGWALQPSSSDWRSVADGDAAHILGGADCENWTNIDCPTPKQNCVNRACFIQSPMGAIENKKQPPQNQLPCGTGDMDDAEWCPNAVRIYAPCGT